jgi:hypothetical protein
VKLRLYHGSKPEGRLQLEEAINEAAAGKQKGTWTHEIAIQWHKDWQYAYNVVAGIAKKCCNKF